MSFHVVRGPRRGRRRAVVLVVTVLLISAAASIAYALAYQASMSLAGENARADATGADKAARSAIEAVELTLAADPLAFTRVVLGGEAPRTCLTGAAAGAAFGPGTTWPASCGAVWSYTSPTAQWTGTRVEITPPSDLDGALTVTARVRTATGTEAVDAARYLPRGAGVFTWASTGSVAFSTASPSDDFSLTGSMYATTVTAAPTQAVSVTGVLAGETLTAPSQIAGVSWAGPAEAAGPPQVGSVRNLQPAPLTEAHLASLTTALTTIGCPDAAPAELPGERATHLCLTPGASLLRSDGTTVSVPSTARSFHLVPLASGELEIWYSTESPSLGASSTLLCATAPSTCSLPSHFSTRSALSAHPGHSSFWSSGSLGPVAPPATGVVAASETLYLGRCDAYAASTCAALEGADPGVTFRSDVTIVAPIVVVGSPVHAAAGADVALAASSTLRLAYWSRPSAGSSAIEAHLLGVSGVEAFPSQLGSTGVADPNWDAELSITGSMTGAGLSTGLAGWRSVQLAPADSSFSSPPWFSATSWGWERVSLSPAGETASGFTPAAIPGLLLWLDITDASTRTISSGQFSGWGDKSLRESDLTTASPGNPVFAAHPAGGILSFSGAASSLSTTAAPRTGTGPMTLAVVVSSGSGSVIVWGSSPGDQRHLYLSSGRPSYANSSDPAGVGVDVLSAPDPMGAGLHVVVLTVDSAGNAVLYVDGVEEASGSVPSDTADSPAVVGSSGSGLNFSGLLGEMVVYNQELSGAEIDRLTAHLLAKWVTG